MKIFVPLAMFAKFAEDLVYLFLYKCEFAHFVILVILTILISVFFDAISVLFRLRFLQTSLDFCKRFLLIMCLLKLRQIFARKFLLQLPILVEFVFLAIFVISSIHF